MPSVSVVIPTYQYGHFVRDAVESVLRQTVEDLELLVVDDGSTDNTEAVLSEIKDPRLAYIKQPHQGVSAARNAGLNRATSRYIAFLDADDIWSPYYLECQLEVLEAEPDVGLCFTDFVRKDETHGGLPATYMDFMPELEQTEVRPSLAPDGYVIEGDAFVMLVSFKIYPYSVGVTVIKREVIDKKRGEQPIRFPVGVQLGEDRHFLLRCYLRTSVAFIPEPLAEQRRHPTNTTKQPHKSPGMQILSSLLHEPMTKVQRRALLKRIAQAHCAEGYREVRNGHKGRAARAYGRALRYPGRRLTAMTRIVALPFLHGRA